MFAAPDFTWIEILAQLCLKIYKELQPPSNCWNFIIQIKPRNLD